MLTGQNPQWLHFLSIGIQFQTHLLPSMVILYQQMMEEEFNRQQYSMDLSFQTNLFPENRFE